MSTAVNAVVQEIEVLRHSAGLVDRVLRLNTGGISQQESLVQPRPAGNCINWIVGHLVCSYQHALPLLGQAPVVDPAHVERYERGTPPLENPAAALELSELLAAWEKVHQRIDTGLANLKPEILDQKAPFSPGNNPNETVRSLLTTFFFHGAYHVGQLGVLRRIVGKSGAIT
jgi:hypothetical protein